MPLHLDRLADRVTLAHDRGAVARIRARHAKAVGAKANRVPTLIRAEVVALCRSRGPRPPGRLLSRLLGYLTPPPGSPRSLVGDSIHGADRLVFSR